MQGLSEQQKLIITVISVVVSSLTDLCLSPSCSALQKPFVCCVLYMEGFCCTSTPPPTKHACLQRPPNVVMRCTQACLYVYKMWCRLFWWLM